MSDFAFDSDMNLSGIVTFGGTGLTSADQALLSSESSARNVGLNNSDVLSDVGFSGDSSDIPIGSGDTNTAAGAQTPIPEPSSVFMLATLLVGLAGYRRFRRPPRFTL